MSDLILHSPLSFLKPYVHVNGYFLFSIFPGPYSNPLKILPKFLILKLSAPESSMDSYFSVYKQLP